LSLVPISEEIYRPDTALSATRLGERRHDPRDVSRAPSNRLAVAALWFQQRHLPARFARPRRVVIDQDVQIWLQISETIGAGIYLYGTSEYFCTSTLKALLGPGMTVVDAGAHVGEHTLVASKRVGAHGFVLAFEPQPAVFALLERSIAENRFAEQNVDLTPFFGPPVMRVRVGVEHAIGGRMLLGFGS
jgi:hypothetical protein